MSERGSTERQRPGRLTVLRNISTYVLGWVLIFQQAGIVFDPPQNPNESLIWGAFALIAEWGISGAATMLGARFGVGAQPGSSPAPEASPQPPS